VRRPFTGGETIFVLLRAAGAVGVVLVLIAVYVSCRQQTANSPAGASPNTTAGAADDTKTPVSSPPPEPDTGSEPPAKARAKSDEADPLAGMSPELLAQLAEAEAAAAAEEQHGACGICHIDTTDEFNGSLHETEEVACVDCHGPSEGHVEDENNDVKPDEVFARADVDRLCEKCHECSRPDPAKPVPVPRKERKVCTDCHAAHQFPLEDTPQMRDRDRQEPQ